MKYHSLNFGTQLLYLLLSYSLEYGMIRFAELWGTDGLGAGPLRFPLDELNQIHIPHLQSTMPELATPILHGIRKERGFPRL